MTNESHEAIVVVETPETTVEAHEPEPIGLGQWYWVKYKNGEFLECCTHVGSNYAEMTGVNEGDHRIHFDEFDQRCRRELSASTVIGKRVDGYQQEVRRLMGEIQAITARLGVGHAPALSAGSAALARLDGNQDVGSYKAALVKAKEEDLPALFKAIEEANSKMAMWMKAEVLPMRAQVGQMHGSIERIDDRIFNVELYAGLVEQVVQITEGDPAGMTEKVRLMQRRHYMDEECLAQYQTGGMEFGDIDDFDDWLANVENRDRLLPFPRCIVAFQVRRNTKEREIPRGFIQMFNFIMTVGHKIEADRLTFLYIRNGDNLYRLSTELRFGSRLFPDTNHHTLTAGTKLWAKCVSGGSSVGDIITEDRYHGLLEDYAREKAAFDAKKAEHPAKLKAWRQAKKAAKGSRIPFTEREPYIGWFSESDPKGRYQPYEPNNINYDDIQKKIATEIQQANRIAIIIQGLLDRSTILHPHPPWKIWSEGVAEQALELIYDDSRALSVGEQPDFEAYRKRLNRTLKAGSITVGQQTVWLKDRKEQDDPDYGSRRGRRKHRGDGPGTLARVVSYQARAGRCTYAWNRDSESYDNYGKKIRCQYTCDASGVLNVDAYRPGDFKQFFADPRTRADYVKWAPLLLEAEEFHAGNREVDEPPVKVKKVSSWEGREAYKKRREREQLVGKAVRLVRNVETQSGTAYKKGSLWRVRYNERGLYIVQINPDGTRMKDGGSIRCMEAWDLEEDPKIPPEPPKPQPTPEPEPDDDDDDLDEPDTNDGADQDADDEDPDSDEDEGSEEPDE